jgi:CO dehydrogenase nickel-insertion accessory protein CooC1
MTKVSQFVARYLTVEQGYDLICLLEHLSRETKTSVDTLLAVALTDKTSAEYLVGCVNRLTKNG